MYFQKGLHLSALREIQFQCDGETRSKWKSKSLLTVGIEPDQEWGDDPTIGGVCSLSRSRKRGISMGCIAAAQTWPHSARCRLRRLQSCSSFPRTGCCSLGHPVCLSLLSPVTPSGQTFPLLPWSPGDLSSLNASACLCCHGCDDAFHVRSAH